MKVKKFRPVRLDSPLHCHESKMLIIINILGLTVQ